MYTNLLVGHSYQTAKILAAAREHRAAGVMLHAHLLLSERGDWREILALLFVARENVRKCKHITLIENITANLQEDVIR